MDPDAQPASNAAMQETSQSLKVLFTLFFYS